ncbi:MAG: glycosyltransferase [Myxococcota bacterium]
MASPDVSVVMPVRDAAGTLEAAVDSVLSSRGIELELICVDDGSQDESRALLDRAAARDPRVRVTHGEPRGIVAALNTGLAQAEAPLVARMDADDAMLPERLAAQAAYLDQHPETALVGCQVECFRAGGLREGYRLYSDWVNGLVEPGEIERQMFVECPIPHPTWTFRRPAVDALGGYRDRGWPEDLDLLYRLLATGAGIAKVPRVLHRWRDHPGRLSRVDPSYGREAFARVKAHFLPLLRPMPAAIVWGAGRTGRRLVRLLEAEGLPTRALLDVNPRRIGTTWHGIPVFSPEQLRSRAKAWRDEGLRVLVAVASRGARQEIREHLDSLDLAEGRDFLMVA